MQREPQPQETQNQAASAAATLHPQPANQRLVQTATERDALNPPPPPPPANVIRSLRQQHASNTRDSNISPHQNTGARDRDMSRSPPQVAHPRLPRRQDSTSATSGEGGSPELPARSALLSTEGDTSRPQANPEDIMSIIAQMSPTQYAQMREQMLREQMLEQLNQLLYLDSEMYILYPRICMKFSIS